MAAPPPGVAGLVVDGMTVEGAVRATAQALAERAVADDLLGADVVVLLDAACPFTSVEFVRAAIDHASETGRAVVAVREVTDTLVRIDQRGACDYSAPDRAEVRQLAAPVVIPAPVLATLPDDACDLVEAGLSLAEVVAALPAYEELDAPPSARRIVDGADLEVLGAYLRHEAD